METQADLTPFQRMVLLRELEAQQEDASPKQSGGGGGRVNSLRQPSGGGARGETVTYVNEDGAD